MIDPTRCPICGQPNDCQVAAGRPTCWCFERPVPLAVLARVPFAAQGLACVCQTCATTSDEALRRRQAMRWTRR